MRCCVCRAHGLVPTVRPTRSGHRHLVHRGQRCSAHVRGRREHFRPPENRRLTVPSRARPLLVGPASGCCFISHILGQTACVYNHKKRGKSRCFPVFSFISHILYRASFGINCSMPSSSRLQWPLAASAAHEPMCAPSHTCTPLLAHVDVERCAFLQAHLFEFAVEL